VRRMEKFLSEMVTRQLHIARGSAEKSEGIANHVRKSNPPFS